MAQWTVCESINSIQTASAYDLEIENGASYMHGWLMHTVMQNHIFVEAHCYIVNIRRTDHEQIHNRINNN